MKHLSMSVSVSDTHSSKNAHQPTAEALDAMSRLIAEDLGADIEAFRKAAAAIELFGTEASMDFPGLNKVYYADQRRKGWQHPLSVHKTGISEEDPYPRQLSHFCRVIRGEEQPRTPGTDAVKTMKVIQAVFESGQTRQPAPLDL